MNKSSRDSQAVQPSGAPDGLGYAAYLRLDQLLAAQQPLSSPPQHDEMLFIVQHQVAELWMKLLNHELEAVWAALHGDQLARAITTMHRIKQIQVQLFEQWSVLETLSPVDYLQFRGALGSASGFQSAQYRELVFLLGEKDATLLAMFADQPQLPRLQQLLQRPSIYQELLLYLARHGHPIPVTCLQGDWQQTRTADEQLWPVLSRIYHDRQQFDQVHAFCEQLVDFEEQFQLWRFRHLKTVERVIGWRRGTGGSSGVDFLKMALNHSFFPELLAIRTRL